MSQESDKTPAVQTETLLLSLKDGDEHLGESELVVEYGDEIGVVSATVDGNLIPPDIAKMLIDTLTS
jgi:hypothetical protein